MNEAVKGVLIGLLGSKKFMALLLGLLVTAVTYPLVNWLGLEAEAAAEAAKAIATSVMGLVSAYMLSQGFADHGKEAKKTTAARPKL